MDQLLLHEMGVIDNIEEESDEENDFYANEKEEEEHLAKQVAELINEESERGLIKKIKNLREHVAILMNEESANEREEIDNFVKGLPKLIIEESTNEKQEIEHLTKEAELINEESTILGNSTIPHAEGLIDIEKSDSEEYVSLSDNDDCESVSPELTFSEIHSIRSMSTTTTIPPEVVRDRVKKLLEKRERATVRHRNLAKGEASAVNRQRRENKNTIKDSFGIWG